MDSKILEKDESTLIGEWVGKPFKAQLLYRATRDGFASSAFHSKCDNQGQTICIIKSSNGNRFGGILKISKYKDSLLNLGKVVGSTDNAMTHSCLV